MDNNEKMTEKKLLADKKIARMIDEITDNLVYTIDNEQSRIIDKKTLTKLLKAKNKFIQEIFKSGVDETEDLFIENKFFYEKKKKVNGINKIVNDLMSKKIEQMLNEKIEECDDDTVLVTYMDRKLFIIKLLKVLEEEKFSDAIKNKTNQKVLTNQEK